MRIEYQSPETVCISIDFTNLVCASPISSGENERFSEENEGEW